VPAAVNLQAALGEDVPEGGSAVTDSPPDEQDREPEEGAEQRPYGDEDHAGTDAEPEARHRPDNDGETVPE
jgi:hypothetical protein